MKMTNLIMILNQCDIADYNGESLSWFYDDETNEVTFEVISSGEMFTVKNDNSFSLVDNEIELYTTSEETVFLDLYVVNKPTFEGV